MSTAHHGDQPRHNRALEQIIQRFNDQMEGRVRRAYSQGRISPQDDGDLAFAIAADKGHGTVVIDFGKPVTWIGLKPDDVARLVKVLVEKAQEVAKEPFTVEF